MSTLTLTWTGLDDVKTCQVCKRLIREKHTWQVDKIPNVLTAHGQTVWDTVADEPRTHGGAMHHCRCELLKSFDLASVQTRLKLLKSRMLQVLGSREVWSKMGTVTVLRSHGRFVTWRKTP